MLGTILINVLAGVLVVVLFGLAIFIHEFGHFLAARWLGLTVDTFSIGFGPALWKRRAGGVLYKISVIPFGGYVALPQLDPSGMDTVQGSSGSDSTGRKLPPVAPWRRIIVACAGPFGNLVLAVVIAWVIYLAPQAATGGANTIIGTVDEDAPAWQAGMRPGQSIERVNGQRVETWFDFMVECHLSGDPARGVALTVRDNGKLRQIQVPLATNLLADVHVVAGVAPKSLCSIVTVMSNGVAAAAGVCAGDSLRTVNGVPVVGAGQFVEYMTANGTNLVTLALVRHGQPLTFRLTPRFDVEAGRPMLGVQLGDAFDDVPVWMQYRNPWRQISSDGAAVFRLLRALIFPQHTGEAKRAAQSVGGPLFIIIMLWQVVQKSLLSSLGFLRLISVNLAIINLLPIPVLDGGHVIFALWETVTRRPPHPRVVSLLVNAFAVLLIGLMLLLVGHDSLRMHLLFDKHPRAAVTNAVPASATATNHPPATPGAPKGTQP